ncbi:hypothetical protein Q3G72_005321 [Acer saccharum]|nr:hypothetical protein Q3G72_005321 [Acer saccharum]
MNHDKGLLRCGTSCRLRWVNYLRPNIKRGNIAPDEEDLIIRLHTLLGNRWSLIAKCLPGRTDNEMIKNYWNTHLSKRSLEKTTSSDHPKSSKETKKTLKKKNKKNQTTIINHEQANEESAKTKIYLPKAIRGFSILVYF